MNIINMKVEEEDKNYFTQSSQNMSINLILKLKKCKIISGGNYEEE